MGESSGEAPRVFLTGASSGIGAALARHYAARGATLGLVARRAEALQALKNSLGTPAELYACDVRDRPALSAAGEQFIALHGVPDIVIANAGISHGTLTEIAADAPVFRDILEVNVMGMVHTFQPFVAAMRARGSGTLVGIASVAGFRGIPGASAYSASKAAAIRYLEALRVELHGTGVQVTTICPGYIATAMTAKNPYRMPFLLEADDAARRFARVIDEGRSYAIIPWQMAIVGRILAVLPNALFDRLAARAGRKPRKD
ncbi:MAG TPA: SDR family oxidoreductase [Usitatibacter sp.]|nr:SDR family oxidoreductase [Usitatibacter sp.]